MAEKEYIEKWETLRNMKMDVAPPFKVVQEMPPADVVEVVRCKDCIHYVPMDKQYDYKGRPAMFCAWHSRLSAREGYCDEGYRKEKK